VDREDAEAAARARPNDAQKQAELALAKMSAGDEGGAKAAIDRALALDAKHGVALWLKAQLAKTSGDKGLARRGFDALIAAGHDGYSVRLAMAEVVEKPDERRAALEAAHRFDPLKADPLRALIELDSAAKDTKRELQSLKKLVLLEENDGDAYRRLLQLLLADKSFEEARALGEAGVFVDVESAAMHTLYAEALAQSGARKEALFELESATYSGGEPGELAEAHQKLADALKASGDQRGAKAHAKTASELRQKARTGPI
jgi:tetratricopeptide (TPR) repeat protein